MATKQTKRVIQAPVRQVLDQFHPLPVHCEHERVEETLVNGRVKRSIVLEQENLHDRYKGMTVDDFSLESMQLAGSLPDTPSHYTSTDGLDSTCAALDAAANLLENETNSKSTE